MKIIILLHSSTGNTKLVARWAAGWLEAQGQECRVHDVTREKEPPDFDDYDLLGVACPTMYFRPTWVIERYVLNMPRSARPKPAFLLATAGGDPGSHFTLLAQWLELKNYVTLGARLSVFPNNWPVHRGLVQGLHLAEPLAALATHRFPDKTALLSTFWPDLGVCDDSEPAKIEAMVAEVLRRAEAGDLSSPPDPATFFKGGAKAFELGGKMMDRSKMEAATTISVDSGRCTACGTCAKVCPVGCITLEEGAERPTIGSGCSGCWACFNRCPEGALAGWKTPAGRGRYRGPSPALRSLFKPPKAEAPADS